MMQLGINVMDFSVKIIKCGTARNVKFGQSRAVVCAR